MRTVSIHLHEQVPARGAGEVNRRPSGGGIPSAHRIRIERAEGQERIDGLGERFRLRRRHQ
jgi:hypothetical protein